VAPGDQLKQLGGTQPQIVSIDHARIALPPRDVRDGDSSPDLAS
jgi:hypothetical protein